jgi:hypothetical protein
MNSVCYANGIRSDRAKNRDQVDLWANRYVISNFRERYIAAISSLYTFVVTENPLLIDWECPVASSTPLGDSRIIYHITVANVEDWRLVSPFPD